MNVQNELNAAAVTFFKEHYQITIEHIEFQNTKQEIQGDITVLIFPLLKLIKGNPAAIAASLGAYLKKHIAHIKDFNVVQGFLNLVLSDAYFLQVFYHIFSDESYGIKKPDGSSAMVEYSSPNTNKPLHLGHIRNNLLGSALANILKASGKKVYTTQIINDRGIHICKSMLAWQLFAQRKTPKSTGIKGDKFVGNYYVKFDEVYKKQIQELIQQGKSETHAVQKAPILLQAKDLLSKWENKDPQTRTLWEKMNAWVYEGFEKTYKDLGVTFDKNYYESKTYRLGKDIILKGLERGIFFKKQDKSVWIDLSEQGLDEKLVLRSDGTSVYITQDIGTAVERFKDFGMQSLIYTVGNEQDYHFKVLFLILQKLGYPWAKRLYHLSYGMVDLPSGKMKSREGTVVDADDLIAQMIWRAGEIASQLGKLEGYSECEKESLYKIIGMGALKYYILKVDPKKRIVFDPKESIDFNGNTGPFIQYTYARIQSILRKVDFCYDKPIAHIKMNEKEKNIVKQLQQYPDCIGLAAKNNSPALIANYVYDLVKKYNSFYQSFPILGCEQETTKIFRLQLSKKVAGVIKSGFHLLGIQVPERM